MLPSGKPGSSYSRPVPSQPPGANLRLYDFISDSEEEEPQAPAPQAAGRGAQANQEQMGTLLELVSPGTDGFDRETLNSIRQEFMDLLRSIQVLPDSQTRRTQLEQLQSGLISMVKNCGDFARPILSQVDALLKPHRGTAALRSIDREVRELVALGRVNEERWTSLIHDVLAGSYAGDRVSQLDVVDRALQNLAMLRGVSVASLRKINDDARKAATVFEDALLACEALERTKRFDPEKDPRQIKELCNRLLQAHDVPVLYRQWLRQQTCAALAQVAEATQLPELKAALLDIVEQAAHPSEFAQDPEFFEDPSACDTVWAGRSGSARDFRLSPAHDDRMIRFEDRLKACLSALRFAATSLGAGDVALRFEALISTVGASHAQVRDGLYDTVALEFLLLEQEHPGICKQVLPEAEVAGTVDGKRLEPEVRALYGKIVRLLEDFDRRRESDYAGRIQKKDCPELIAEIRREGGEFQGLLLAKLARGLNVHRLSHNDMAMRAAMTQVLDTWFHPAFRNGHFEALEPQ